MFKVGCRGCDEPSYTPQLCHSCQEKAESIDTMELESKIADLKEKLFPAMNNTDMTEETRKRTHPSSDSSDDEVNNVNKLAKSDQ